LVPALVLEGVPEVARAVGHVGLVDLLDPAVGDELGGHPVGQDDQVPTGRQLADEGRLDRLDEGCVVADLLLVVDLDLVFLLELLERRRRTGLVGARLAGRTGEIDVGGPVGELEGAADDLWGGGRRRARLGRGRKRRGDRFA
jgi:hypothetical protein